MLSSSQLPISSPVEMPESKDSKLNRIFGVCPSISFFFFFRPAPEAYGSSQARDQIGAVAASLHHSHSNTRSELCL